MKWYRKLYLGDGIRKSKEELMKKIETGAGLPGIYVLTLASNGWDLFDIFSSNDLMQPVLHGLCPVIVGLASGYDEAVEMAKDIALESYQKTGAFDICAYLQSRIPEGEKFIYEYPMEKLRKRKHFLFGRKTQG